MGIIDKIKGRIQDRLNDPAFMGLVQEQSLRDLLIRREFRIPQEYLQHEFLDKALDDELVEFKLTIGNGYGALSGRLKKRLVPFAIPFSASFTIEGLEFSAARRSVFLKLGPVAPLDLDWLTKKVVQRIPSLNMTGDMLVCDLNKVPRLAELFAYRVKGISIWDYITLRELWLKQGEIGGRVGVVL